jgi:hypothetical protein
MLSRIQGWRVLQANGTVVLYVILVWFLIMFSVSFEDNHCPHFLLKQWNTIQKDKLRETYINRASTYLWHNLQLDVGGRYLVYKPNTALMVYVYEKYKNERPITDETNVTSVKMYWNIVKVSSNQNKSD